MKQVIYIFGASGSGTTSLGKRICAELGYRFMDTDDYYWFPTDPKYTHKRPIPQRLSLMKEDILRPGNVVVSGALSGWGDELIPLFTLAVRLEMDASIRMERLKKRERETFGSRIDPGGDMYQIHLAFMEWAKNYDNGGMEIRSKRRHDQWQKLLPCRLIQLDDGDSLDDNFSIVKSALENGSLV